MPFGKSVNLNRTPGANMGSKATPRAMQKAMGTASGSSQSRPSQQTEVRSQASSAGKAAINRGSRAGLKDAKNVWIQPNNRGYLNPSNQTARLVNRTRKVDITPPTSRAKTLTPFRKTFDNRLYSSEKSSICLLKNRMS